jgi:hypothetical protein
MSITSDPNKYPEPAGPQTPPFPSVVRIGEAASKVHVDGLPPRCMDMVAEMLPARGVALSVFSVIDAESSKTPPLKVGVVLRL